MSKFDQRVVQQACDSLIYKYLVESGHLKTAELLKKKRKRKYNLKVKKDERISEMFSFMISTKYVQLKSSSNIMQAQADSATMKLNVKNDTVKMSKIDQEIQQICDSLIYKYLVENGLLKTAELLEEERKNFYTLKAKKNENISEMFSSMITKYVQLELDMVSNNLVYDYLKKQENPKIQKLAEKVKSLVPPMQIRGETPSIGEILNHTNVSRKILVPVRKKLSNQLPNQAKGQNSSIKKAPEIALKSKADLAHITTNLVSYSYGSGEKVVPIKDVFISRINDIEFFKHDKPEVYKVLKYILGCGMKVMKAQADTIEIELIINLDKVDMTNRLKSQMVEKKIKLRAFSHVRSGEDSEESRIIKAWDDLIEEAQIIDKKQLFQDFDNLLTKQWLCNMIGCYLSKYLEVPRVALKVFELLTRSAFYNSGNFQEEEDEIIIQHMQSQNGMEPDLNYLKLILNRPRISIYNRIANLKAPKARSGQEFTIDDYLVILKHVLGTKIPKEANEIIKLCDRNKSWKSLESKLQRNHQSIAQGWSGIYSTVLAHLSGTLNLDWRKNFFQFIIDKKYISVTEIDWNIVKETWPSVPKYNLTQAATNFVKNLGKRGLPLYQNISENLHHMKDCQKISQLKLDLIDEFEKLRNKD
jgi:hypothetical protein